MLVAGEASGDLHATRLLEAVRTRCGDVEAFGLGGDGLLEAGLDSVGHSSEVAVVGITEVLKILPRARELFRKLVDRAAETRPTVAVLVDFPEFNLRLAKALKRLGIPVIYYISPQVWAWRRGRVKTIARCVDEMLVLFPFEAKFYENHDVTVEHVGHPLVDEVPELPQAWDRGETEERCVAILPGSRPSEVRALAPTMLAAAKLLVERSPGLVVRWIVAPSLDRAEVDRLVSEAGIEVEIVTADRFEAVASSHVALCASGTATLEVGLLGTPMVVLYKLQPWSYRLAKWLVDLPSFSLVNLVLGRSVVPELLQAEASPERAAAEASALFDDPTVRDAQRAALEGLRAALGVGGASERAAEVVARRLCPERDAA